MLGLAGRGGGACVRAWAPPALCPSYFWDLVSPACLPSVPLAILSLLLRSAPPPLSFSFAECLRFFARRRGVVREGGRRVRAGVAVGVCDVGCWRGCVPV